MNIEAPFSAYVDIATVAGCTSVRITSLKEISEYKADPQAFAARHFGMTVEQYRTWIWVDGALHCTGHTASGRPCRNIFANQLSARDWLAAWPTARCHLHQDDAS